MTGLRVSAGMGVVVVTAVEFVASESGLGYLIWNSWQLFQPSTMFVGLIMVSLIGAGATGLIILLERTVLPWRRAGRATRGQAPGSHQPVVPHRPKPQQPGRHHPGPAQSSLQRPGLRR